MFKQQLEKHLKQVLKDLSLAITDPVLYISQSPQFGDYSSSVALQQPNSKSMIPKQRSLEIAKKIVRRVEDEKGVMEYVEKVEVAGPGFVNFFIKDEVLLKELKTVGQLPKVGQSRKILVEYGGQNPLKEVHIGHLRNFILGESICRIFENLGHQVFRANYQGDIGLHIAKAIWGVKKLGLPTTDLSHEGKAEFMGKAYAEGSIAYEGNPALKQEIGEINKKLYQKDTELDGLYHITRDWSLEYFQPIYDLLGIKYDRLFFESETYERGRELVLVNVGSPREAGKVFEESQGAIIFPGEKQGLHNRVFITQEGNPTYEAKDLGLAELQYQAFNFDSAIHVVAHEQAGYFQVVFQAIEMLFPYLKGREYHLGYGLVDLKEGKMSSRAGNVVTVDDLYKVVLEKVREVMKQNEKKVDQDVAKQVAIGAIKFSYLKVSPNPNMVFDLQESVSLQGDSGPYLQYTYARTQSLLRNANSSSQLHTGCVNVDLEIEERAILVKLSYFPEVVEAASQFRPNLICEYLVELAAQFNMFYQKYRIIDSDKKEFRLVLTKAVGEVLKKGLDLLGIEAPNRM